MMRRLIVFFTGTWIVTAVVGATHSITGAHPTYSLTGADAVKTAETGAMCATTGVDAA